MGIDVNGFSRHAIVIWLTFCNIYTPGVHGAGSEPVTRYTVPSMQENLYDAEVVLHTKVLNRTSRVLEQADRRLYPIRSTRYYTNLQVLCVLKSEEEIPEVIILDTDSELTEMTEGARYIFGSRSFQKTQTQRKTPPTYISPPRPGLRHMRYIYQATNENLASASKVCGLQKYRIPNNNVDFSKEFPILCPELTVDNTTCVDPRNADIHNGAVTIETSKATMLSMMVMCMLLMWLGSS